MRPTKYRKIEKEQPAASMTNDKHTEMDRKGKHTLRPIFLYSIGRRQNRACYVVWHIIYCNFTCHKRPTANIYKSTTERESLLIGWVLAGYLLSFFFFFFFSIYAPAAEVSPLLAGSCRQHPALTVQCLAALFPFSVAACSLHHQHHHHHISQSISVFWTLQNFSLSCSASVTFDLSIQMFVSVGLRLKAKS